MSCNTIFRIHGCVKYLTLLRRGGVFPPVLLSESLNPLNTRRTRKRLLLLVCSVPSVMLTEERAGRPRTYDISEPEVTCCQKLYTSSGMWICTNWKVCATKRDGTPNQRYECHLGIPRTCLLPCQNLGMR